MKTLEREIKSKIIYFIRGHKYRGEEVISLLEQYGGIKTIRKGGFDESCYYYFSKDDPYILKSNHPFSHSVAIELTLPNKRPYINGNKIKDCYKIIEILKSVGGVVSKEFYYTSDTAGKYFYLMYDNIITWTTSSEFISITADLYEIKPEYIDMVIEEKQLSIDEKPIQLKIQNKLIYIKMSECSDFNKAIESLCSKGGRYHRDYCTENHKKGYLYFTSLDRVIKFREDINDVFGWVEKEEIVIHNDKIYWITGVPGKAEKVKKALSKVGGRVENAYYSYESPYNVYYVERSLQVKCCDYLSDRFHDFIHDQNAVELKIEEDEPEFEHFDKVIILTKANKWKCDLYSHKDKNGNHICISYQHPKRVLPYNEENIKNLFL